ncbi:hypothetical protein [Micromonospora sp. WMMD737]|uniref:hypothetical protein n=1 Tax=Micromonospora sp. WMMD737 TaxID=3404113 RepID=UPI003B93060E
MLAVFEAPTGLSAGRLGARRGGGLLAELAGVDDQASGGFGRFSSLASITLC